MDGDNTGPAYGLWAKNKSFWLLLGSVPWSHVPLELAGAGRLDAYLIAITTEMGDQTQHGAAS